MLRHVNAPPVEMPFVHVRAPDAVQYQDGDFSPVAERQDVVIRVEQDVSKLITLQTEHNRYYQQAPIFIQKLIGMQDVLTELSAHAQQRDVFFVYDEQDEPCAYLIVGESTS